jgi:hypothetical protein
MRYSKKRYSKKKSKKGGSSIAFRRGFQTLRTVMREAPPRNLNTAKIKKITNSIHMGEKARQNFNTLSKLKHGRNRRAVYNPYLTIARVAQPIAPIQLKEQSNILNSRGIILKDYSEDCHGCVPVKKDELVKIILEYKTTDKIKVERERDGRSGKVPRDYVKIIN